MKLTVDRDRLHAAMTRAGRVVERRNTTPILSNVRIVAEGNRLLLTTTDLDIEAVSACPAVIATPGEITAPAHLIADIAGKLPKGAQVVLDLSDTTLAINSGRSRFKLQTLPATDFPQLSAGTFDWQFSLHAKTLLRLLGRTAFAISSEETRFYLNGIYLHAPQVDGAPVLTAVATDGHRLARQRCAVPAFTAGTAETFHGGIVPTKAINEILRLVKDQDGDIELAFNGRLLRVTLPDETVLTTKLIDGTFPDYARVIPAGNTNVATLDRQALAEAVERVTTVSTEKTRAVKFDFRKGELTVSVQTQDGGAGEDTLDAAYEAADLTVGFNGAYTRSILDALTSKTCAAAFATAAEPSLWSDPDDADFLAVLMPMRV